MVDRLAGAMAYRAKGTTCRHCNENKAMSGYSLCSFCNQVSVRLSEAIRAKRITKLQRRILWDTSKGSLQKTRILRESLKFRKNTYRAGDSIRAVITPLKEST